MVFGVHLGLNMFNAISALHVSNVRLFTGLRLVFLSGHWTQDDLCVPRPTEDVDLYAQLDEESWALDRRCSGFHMISCLFPFIRTTFNLWLSEIWLRTRVRTS